MVVALLAGLAACSSSSPIENTYHLPYNFSNPDSKNSLPESLNEISGQTVLNDSTIACIQDENGIIFLYDTKKNSIRQQITFAGDGDYEGICRVEKDLYVLRSDGVLYRVVNYASATPTTEEYVTGIPADNNEGLCYDSLQNCLLIACKSRIGKEKADKDERAVYGFDLATKKLIAEPMYSFSVTDVIEFADMQEIELPTKTKKHGEEPNVKFRMSAIGVHPVTRELYILSAADHMLFIYNHEPTEIGTGDMHHVELLKESLFNKAEGISFYPNGDVLITNEAQDKKPTLLRFNYSR